MQLCINCKYCRRIKRIGYPADFKCRKNKIGTNDVTGEVYFKDCFVKRRFMESGVCPDYKKKWWRKT